MKKLARWFYERPYLAHNEQAPEKSGLVYGAEVFLGFKYWAQYEVSQWKAWAFTVVALLSLYGTVYFAEKPVTGALNFLASIEILFFLTAGAIALMASITRLTNWLFATSMRTTITMLTFVVSMVIFILYDFDHFWADPFSRLVGWTLVGGIILGFITIIVGVLARKQRNQKR